MKQSSKIGVGAVVTTLAALVGIWATLNPWPAIGWVTPNQHEAELAQIRGNYQIAVDDILDQLKENQDEWKCDEYEEELAEALQKQRDGDDSVELEQLIERIRKAIERRDCGRFEDFG